MGKRLNSAEIARLAGVSRSTVSRVINGYDNVSESTREQVMKYVKEQEYYPMLSGQLLSGMKTRTLAHIWITGGKVSVSSDILCSEYYVRVAEAAARQGYLVLSVFMLNRYDPEEIENIKRLFMQGRVDGGVVVGANNREPLVEKLVEKGLVVGQFDHEPSPDDPPNHLSVNFEKDTGEKMVDYLYALGHRKIAMMDGSMNRYTCVNRHDSFVKGMNKYGLDIRSSWMYYAGISESGGYNCTMELLQRCRGENMPTAICANNDNAAFGVYRALKEMGLRIPDDVSVVSIDGHRACSMVEPGLTTFSYDYRDVFSSLVTRTISAIEGEENVPQTEYIPSTLIERGSCRGIETP